MLPRAPLEPVVDRRASGTSPEPGSMPPAALGSAGSRARNSDLQTRSRPSAGGGPPWLLVELGLLGSLPHFLTEEHTEHKYPRSRGCG